MWISRTAQAAVEERLRHSAAVQLLGPRQVGKTSLAHEVVRALDSQPLYLDLDDPRDRTRLTDPAHYLEAQSGRLVIIDEAQQMPELFEVLRGVIDGNRRAGHRTGQFLLLGSASLDLVRLTESLAGRVSQLTLSGVTAGEASAAGISEERLWLRGGYPESLLAASDEESRRWRTDIVRTYLERDVPLFAPRIPAETLRRLWTMLAHTSGGLFNASRLGEALGVKGQTVDRYVDLLDDLFLVRRLTPWLPNVSKRLTKSPKIHVRDSGLIHALLGLTTTDDVLGHPVAGSSWESFVIENVIALVGEDYRPHFYRTATGDEIDLVLERGGQPAIAIEVKRSTAPEISAGLRRARTDLGGPPTWVIHPTIGREPYDIDGITVGDLAAFAAWVGR